MSGKDRDARGFGALVVSVIVLALIVWFCSIAAKHIVRNEERLSALEAFHADIEKPAP